MGPYVKVISCAMVAQEMQMQIMQPSKAVRATVAQVIHSKILLIYVRQTGQVRVVPMWHKQLLSRKTCDIVAQPLICY